jgi:hypothetical protein
VVSVSDSLPPANGNGGRYGEILVAGRPRSAEGAGAVVGNRWVSPEYLRALDIPIVRGEGFREREEDLGSSDHFVVLSQRLAGLLFPGEDPVGKRLNFDHVGYPDAPWYTVAGVAATVKNGGLTGEEGPEFYRLRRNREEEWGGRGVGANCGNRGVKLTATGGDAGVDSLAGCGAGSDVAGRYCDAAGESEQAGGSAAVSGDSGGLLRCDGLVAGSGWIVWSDLVSGGAADAGDSRAHGAGCGSRRCSADGDGEEPAFGCGWNGGGIDRGAGGVSVVGESAVWSWVA